MSFGIAESRRIEVELCPFVGSCPTWGDANGGSVTFVLLDAGCGPGPFQPTTHDHQSPEFPTTITQNTIHLWPILLALLVIDGLWAGADRHPSGPQPRTVNYQKRKPQFNNHALVP
jgi:hypothetical protein